MRQRHDGTLFRLAAAFMMAVFMPAFAGAGQAAQVQVLRQMQFDAVIADAKATMLADPQQAISKAAFAARLVGGLNPERRASALATSRWLQGEAYLRVDDPKHGGPLIEQALNEVRNVKPVTKLNGDILLSRGGYHTAIADVAGALDDYQRAHNIFRDIGETRYRAVALLSIALLYQEAKDYSNALKYYKQARDVYRGDQQLLLTVYNNRGIVLSEIGQYNEAEEQFNEALTLARTMKSSALVTRVLSNIARNQVKSGRLDLADRTIREGVAMSRTGDAAAAGAQFWGIAAQAAVKRGRYEQARILIERQLATANPKDNSISTREAHETAYQIYSKLGDPAKALTHLEALKGLEDRTSTLAASANNALAAARFDFANQELKITTLQRDEAKRTVEFERSRARTQLFVFVGAGVLTVVVVTMLGFGLLTIRRSRNEVRAANIDLESTNNALAKALAAKTEFLATTSHEIRTPLNGILGMAQVMLADPKLGAAMRDRIGVVHGAGVTMRALVDDILDVAKMETGNLTIEQAPFDLKAALLDLSRLWREQAQAKGIGFVIELDDCPDFVEGDAARMRQIVFNLLSNALKFTEQGSVTLTARSVEDARDGHLLIDVVDTGIGIAADKHDLVFESFRQADGGTTRKFGGTGLGLSICRNLARAMGGDVTLQSNAGEGSLFRLDLPLVRAEAPAAAANKPIVGDMLLILDRNPITRAMLRTVLAPRAANVGLVSSPDEARSSLASGGVSVLLIDDGSIKSLEDPHGAVSTLTKDAHEAGARVALLWAGLDDEARVRFKSAGVDIVIAKPIAGAALAASLYPVPSRDDSAPNALVTQAA